jgi:hypothetical protein
MRRQLKNFYLITIRTLLVVGIFTLLPLAIVGQPSFPATPDPAPIGGGMGLLAVAGGVYAYRKLREK